MIERAFRESQVARSVRIYWRTLLGMTLVSMMIGAVAALWRSGVDIVWPIPM